MRVLNFKICAFRSSRLCFCGCSKANGLYGCEDAIKASCGAGGVLKVVLGGCEQRVLQLVFAARPF